MTKLHITTNVIHPYKPKDTGLNITNDNTEWYMNESDMFEMGRNYEISGGQEYEYTFEYYLPGIVKAFANYTGILLADGKHITLHYGNNTLLPDGLIFDIPVLVKVLGISTSKAGECLVVEVIIPNHNSIIEQV